MTHSLNAARRPDLHENHPLQSGSSKATFHHPTRRLSPAVSSLGRPNAVLLFFTAFHYIALILSYLPGICNFDHLNYLLNCTTLLKRL